MLNLEFQKLLTIVRGARHAHESPPPLGMIFDGLAICFYKSLILLNNKIFLKKFEKRLDERAGKAHIQITPRGKGPQGKAHDGNGSHY